MTGLEIGGELVRIATRGAGRRCVANVTFVGGDLGTIPAGPFDLIACLGVTVFTIDPRTLDELFARFGTVTAPAGYLVMIDSVGIDREYVRSYRDGYVARYRERAAYGRLIEAAGFGCQRSELITNWPGGQVVNRIWLFRRV